MALSAVRELVRKLAADAGLREKLRDDPNMVFEGYDLSVEEKTAVISASSYAFETPSGTVQRVASQEWWAPPAEKTVS